MDKIAIVFRISLIFALLCGCLMHAQTDFCLGRKGFAAFKEDFGLGSGFGTALSGGTTNYEFVAGIPDEGQYTLYNNTIPGSTGLPNPGDIFAWHFWPSDWTYALLYSEQPLQNFAGKLMLVNAGGSLKTIYQRNVSNLCENSVYEFSFWAAGLYNPLINQCTENGGLGTPINLKMQVWDTSETQLIAEYITGNVPNGAAAFVHYGLSFTTPAGIDAVKIKIINNNSQPGCGNDVAIDEIVVVSCGVDSEIQATGVNGLETSYCQTSAPVSAEINIILADPENHFFQWQSRSNNVIWTDISGETNTTLIIPEIYTTTHYRVIYARNQASLSNPNCYFASDVFTVTLETIYPPVSFSGNPVVCGNLNVPPLVVFPVANVAIDWYDAAVGGNLILANSVSYTPASSGTFYAQARSTLYECTSATRTPLTLTLIPGVELPADPPPVTLCGGASVVLDSGSGASGLVYEWDPDFENAASVTVTETGFYTVTAYNSNGCYDSRIFEVISYAPPEIAEITNEGTTIIVTMSFEGDFEFSIDNQNWQSHNIFSDVAPGLVTVYSRDLLDCGFDQKDYLLIIPPKFITPNGDGYNDVFTIPSVESVSEVKVRIFDRFGKLVVELNQNQPTWDGSLNGHNLPSSDYWYRMTLDDGREFKGHFAIKR